MPIMRFLAETCRPGGKQPLSGDFADQAMMSALAGFADSGPPRQGAGHAATAAQVATPGTAMAAPNAARRPPPPRPSPVTCSAAHPRAPAPTMPRTPTTISAPVRTTILMVTTATSAAPRPPHAPGHWPFAAAMQHARSSQPIRCAPGAALTPDNAGAAWSSRMSAVCRHGSRSGILQVPPVFEISGP